MPGSHAISKDEVVISNGATGAFICTCMALFEKGDEVILLEPFYPYHVITLKALGINPVTCNYSDDEFTLIDFELIADKISTRTKAILICTPANPTGKVLSKSELNMFAQICAKHDLYLISDEIYEHITYEERLEHTSALSIRDSWPKVVAISGFSKTFAVTGWRIGYSITDHKLSQKISLVNDFYYVCAPSPLQHALAQSYPLIEDQYFIDMKKTYKRKRDFMIDTLNQVNLVAPCPLGSYYLLADVSCLPGDTSLDKALNLLNSTGVAAVPGQCFYSNPRHGDNILRFCFAKSDHDLKAASERLLVL